MFPANLSGKECECRCEKVRSNFSKTGGRGTDFKYQSLANTITNKHQCKQFSKDIKKVENIYTFVRNEIGSIIDDKTFSVLREACGYNDLLNEICPKGYNGEADKASIDNYLIDIVSNACEPVVYERLQNEQQEKEKELRQKEKQEEQLRLAKAKEKRKYILIGCSLCLLFFIAVSAVLINKYETAKEYMYSGEYTYALDIFQSLGNYKDSTAMIVECKYLKAKSYADQEEYNKAIDILQAIENYKDSNNLLIEYKYERSNQLVEKGSYETAIDAFEELGDYKDSKHIIEYCYYQIAHKYAAAKLYRSALEKMNKAGDYPQPFEMTVLSLCITDVQNDINFGTYEQDNNTNNGEEPISWRIVDRTDNKIILVSNCNLDCIRYCDDGEVVTWAESSARSWLNMVFYKKAFNETERSVLAKNVLHNYGTGGVSADYVYLLSLDEWKEYIKPDKSLNTEYAIAQGVYDENGYGNTWLRSRGIDGSHAQCIDYTGTINEDGFYTDKEGIGIRPVICIDASLYFRDNQ